MAFFTYTCNDIKAADKKLEEQAIIESNWTEAEKAFFNKAEKVEKVETTPSKMQKQKIAMDMGIILKYALSTAALDHIGHQTQYIARQVKNIIKNEDGYLQGTVKIGGVNLLVENQSREEDCDQWDVIGKA